MSIKVLYSPAWTTYSQLCIEEEFGFSFLFKRTSCSKLVEVVYILYNTWSTYLHVILKSFFPCHPLQQHN